MTINGNNAEFVRWLNEQLREKGWTQSVLAARGGPAQSQLSRLVNGEIPPTYKMCRAIAKGLHLPTEVVLEQAGLLPRTPDALPPQMKTWQGRLAQFSEPERALILQAMEASLVLAETTRHRANRPAYPGAHPAPEAASPA